MQLLRQAMQQVNPSSESSIASKRSTFNTLYCLDSVQEEQVGIVEFEK